MRIFVVKQKKKYRRINIIILCDIVLRYYFMLHKKFGELIDILFSDLVISDSI